MPIEIKEVVIKAKVEVAGDRTGTDHGDSTRIYPHLVNMQELIDEAVRAMKDKTER